ncbi:aldo/keto reductase [Candidatus Pelagibacter sp.]|jgi:aryl-alcohol dehydrogenase-like predicted oxidoreductase|nr:aldo/keto reductase [Candidatus Pelagibacter sp.]
MKIAIGSANLGTKYGLFGKKKFEIKELQKVEKLLSKSKIEFIDTAHQYKSSEEIIGKSKLKNLNIITKIKLPKQSTLSINKIVNKIIFKSLKRLNKKTIHSILVHDYRDLLGKKGKEFLKELKMLKRNGFVKNIGISIYDPNDLKKIWKFWKPDLVQIPLNLFDQRILESSWLKILKKNKIQVFARSCFLQGLLIGDYNSLNIPKNLCLHLKKFENWCTTNKISRLKACLDFVRQINQIDCIVVGFNDFNQLNDILNEFKKKSKKISYKLKLSNLNYIDPRRWN